MIHAREDYNNLEALNNRIPEDEPVMIFRAQDELTVDVLDFYISKRKSLYGNDDPLTISLEKFLYKFKEWETKKKADLPKPEKDFEPGSPEAIERDKVETEAEDDNPETPTPDTPEEEGER